RDGDLYMFDEFQTAHAPAHRRPKIDNLYDVFVAIRDDEMEHVKTMVACQKPEGKNTLASPHAPRVQPVGMGEVSLEGDGVAAQ
ncbi:MAG: plastoquinol terminal oxidase, partial [Cyanobacteria bacterium J06649_4]